MELGASGRMNLLFGLENDVKKKQVYMIPALNNKSAYQMINR